MRGVLLVSVLLTGAPAAARASDIGDALKLASETLDEDMTAGFEELVTEEESDEALAILLMKDLDADGHASATAPPFRTLGSKRLEFAQIKPYVQEASERTGLPVALIDAVIRTESGYRPEAVSGRGARGLMQLMPETARELGVKNAFDPRENILGGAIYLRRMYDRFGSMRLALAAYNAGPGTVSKYDGVPPIAETKRYVQTVLLRYEHGRVAGIEQEED